MNADQVKAVYNDGVLALTIPKSERAKAKQIKIELKLGKTERQEFMSEASEKKNPKWFYGVIALLLFLLVLETGILLSRQWSHRESKESPSVIPSETEEPFFPKPSRPALPQRGPFAPDPFAADPFAELQQMRDYMNRLMNMAMTYGPPIAQTLSGGELSDFMPAIDLQETEKTYVVKSDLPGLQKDKINVTVRGNLLTIQGVRENQARQEDQVSGFYAQERSYGSFARSVTLPGPVDESAITADYQNGVLTITLPKLGETKTRQKVPVQ